MVETMGGEIGLQVLQAVQALGVRMDKLEAKVDGLSSEVRVLRSEVGSLRSEVGILRSEVGSLKVRMDRVEARVEELGTEVKRLGGRMDKQEEWFQRLGAEGQSINHWVELSAIRSRRGYGRVNRPSRAWSERWRGVLQAQAGESGASTTEPRGLIASLGHNVGCGAPPQRSQWALRGH